MAQDKELNRDFFVKAGARGGKQTLKKYGKEHFSEIAKKK